MRTSTVSRAGRSLAWLTRALVTLVTACTGQIHEPHGTATGPSAPVELQPGCAAGVCGASCAFQTCQTPSGFECADTGTNARHCGACNAACQPGQSCAGGICQAGCQGGLSSCGGACVDTSQSLSNCGGCGKACGPGSVCAGGQCSCSGGAVSCGGTCVTLATDALHCGDCARACAGGEICDQGACKPSGGGCSGGLTLCGASCVDTRADGANCGTCNAVCGGGETCVSGACACPSGQGFCGGTCVDTQASGTDCGGCGNLCDGGRVCAAGSCSCGAGRTFCEGACVDTTTSSEDCGTCGKVCSGGAVCTGSTCTCSGGQTLCSGACVDLQTSLTSCGVCDQACAAGEVCTAGRCQGPLGADGCSGQARGLTLSQIAVYQSLKIPVMTGGQGVAAGSRIADVVEGRETMVRVFTTLDAGFAPRELSARLTVTNGATVDQYFAKRTVSGASTDADLGSTFQIFLPPDKVTTDTTYAVEIVECGTASGTLGTPRFPAAGDADLGARRTGPLKITLLPVSTNSRLPDTTDAAIAVYRKLMMAMYPTNDVELTVGTQISTSYPVNWTGLLDQIRAQRQTEQPAADVYYYGLIKPADTLQQYCQSSCTAGIGYVSGATQGSTRAAVGLAFADETSAKTMSHEVGHNHGRNHAPCAPGSISGVDSSYPYPNGITNVWGYDSRTRVLLDPSKSTDIMGYCSNKWLSDYTYRGLTDRVATVNGNFELLTLPEAIAAYRVLLLDASGPRWGAPFPAPDAPSGDPEQADALDAAGNVVARVTVYRTEISDIGAWSVLVPPPRAGSGWAAIRVAGSPALAFGSGGSGAGP